MGGGGLGRERSCEPGSLMLDSSSEGHPQGQSPAASTQQRAGGPFWGNLLCSLNTKNQKPVSVASARGFTNDQKINKDGPATEGGKASGFLL